MANFLNFGRNKSEPRKFEWFFNKTDSSIKQQFKGEVLQKEVKFPKELGEEHPFDPKITEALYSKFGLVTGMVDKYVDFIVGPGFFVKSEDERAQEVIEQWIDDVNFGRHLRSWIKDALVKQAGFLELGGKPEESVKGVKVINATTMWVKRTDKGEIIQYNQFLGDTNNFSNDKVISFKPEQIAQLNINPISKSAYGLGRVYPAISTIENIMSAENNMHLLMKRKANSPIHAKLGTADEPPQPGAVTAFGKDFEFLTNKHEFATDYNVDIKVVDFGKFTDNFNDILKHDLDMFFFATQVPEVLMGRGNIPEGLADTQAEAFDRNIRSIQADVEEIIEDKIFTRVLRANRLETKVEFEWGQPSVKENNERITQITELLKNPLLNPELRDQLEVELAIVMKLNPEELLDSQKERDQEENQEQPVVPGQNRDTRQSFHIHEGVADKNTLREWLDFEYEKYVNFIIKAVRKGDFSLLEGTTQEEISRGLLTKKEITQLKKILIEGFKESKTLTQMSETVDNSIQPRSLFSEDGRLIMKAENRSIEIVRTQTTRFAAQGALDNYKAEGITQYTWVASLGERTCPVCEGLNGQVFEIGRGAQPPAHRYCRCTLVPVVPK